MTTLDWIIVAAFLLSTSIAGWRTRKLIKNYDSYLLAGRKVRFFLGMATLGATELGLVTMMYLAQQGYKSGFSTFILGLMALAGLIVIGKTGFIITGLRRLRCRTVSEYYGKRYGRGVQILGAIVLLLAGLINMGTFLIAGATFIVHLIGLNPNFLPFVMTGLLVFVLFYTVLGGMVSVLITDYLQFAILMIGVVVTSVLCVQAVGYTHLIEVLEHEKGVGAFDPIKNPNLGWYFLIWFLINAFFTGMWPPALSRALSTTESKISQKIYFWSGVTFLGRFILPMLWGACAFAYFKMNEPGPTLLLEDGTIDSLAAMPAMLNEILPFGLKGLMLAAGLAAMMSTFDSYLLCWSSTIVNDILDPLSNYQMSDKQKISITRLCVVGCGLFALFWSYFYTPADTMLRFISITGTMFFAGMLGAIALGLYWPKTNSVGAATAIILGCIPPLVTVFLQGSPNIPEYRQWLVDDKTTGITAFVLAVGGSILGSLLTQKIVPPKQLEPIDA